MFYPDEIVIPGKKNAVQESVVVELEVGMCLLHRHGGDCMLVSGFSFFILSCFSVGRSVLTSDSTREERCWKGRSGLLGRIFA